MSQGPHSARLDELYQALPLLGSPEYLAYIEAVAKENLPPEVLVRALRQLPPHSPAWERTLERLLRQSGTSWDYLGPLVAQARRRGKRGSHANGTEVFRDALVHILKTLPTPRGAYAEHSWHAYCRRELSDAWREKYGRRGERFPREEPIGTSLDEDDPDPLVDIATAPPWHATVDDTQVARIESIARKALTAIRDDFVRSVAEVAWFSKVRPRVSGVWKRASGAPLAARFPGKSRFQLIRALRHADSQLAAALLADPELTLADDLRSLLEVLKSGRRRRTSSGKQE